MEKKRNLPDYPYEFFVEEKPDGWHCLIQNCDKVFASYEKYLDHLIYNYSHFNEMKRTIEYFIDDSGFAGDEVIDPIERELINTNIKFNKDFYWLKVGRNASSILEEKIDFAVNKNKMIVGFITGLQGAGKSYFGITLANIILDKEEEKRGYRPRIHIGFERDETLQFVKDAKEGDVIIQDEVPLAAGFGDKTEAKKLRNTLMVLRKRHIHFLFISPEMEKIPGVQFAVEVLSYTERDRVTKAVLYDKRLMALGYCYLEALEDDDPQLVEYEKIKDDFVEKIQLSGGADVDNFNPEQYDKDVAIVLDVIRETDPRMKRSRIRRYVAEYVKNNSTYQSWIADEVFDTLKDEQSYTPDLKDPVEVEKLGVKYRWIHSRTETDIGVLKDVYEFAKRMNLSEDEYRGLEAWRLLHIENMSQQAATTELNKMFSPMSRTMYFRKRDGKINKFIQGSMGTAGEFAIQKWFYSTYSHSGITGEPDLVGDKHIVEVKVRDIDDSRSIESLVERDEYIRSYLANRHPITFVVIWYGSGSVKIDFYIIEYVDTDIEINSVT